MKRACLVVILATLCVCTPQAYVLLATQCWAVGTTIPYYINTNSSRLTGSTPGTAPPAC